MEGEIHSNIPTAVLSDVDDISDIEADDIVDKLHKTINSKPDYDEKRSLFNTMVVLDEAESVCEEDTEIGAAVKAYKEQVMREQEEWVKFIQQIPKPSTQSAAYKPSKEQQAFLNQAPNLQSFIRGMSAFMNDGTRFLQEFQDVQELQEDLKDTCQFLVHKTQRNNIQNSLAKQ